MICHMHQPNMFMNTFLGYTMWDYESDAPLMWPKQELNRSLTEQRHILDRNPEAAAVAGLWGDVDFLSKVWTDVNPKAEDTQFADYHGHGWNFRAIYKRDRKGHLLDAAGKIVPNDAPDKFKRAVHMSSVHVDVGMQCVDCHFAQDGHGNGLLYGEVADAVEIGCKDCHGTAQALPTLRTSNPAAPPQGTDLTLLRTPDGRRRFEWKGNELYQRSMVDPKLEWRMSLVKQTVDPASDALQCQGRAGEADEQGHHHGVEPGRGDQESRPRRRFADLLHLPHLVDHQLRRLPPADRGQLEDAAPAL